jgi:phage terminase large subunit-like protein
LSLSNTATPRYYGEFRDQVLRGEIIVNKQVSQEMNRIDALIRDPNFYYDSEAVEGYIKYCEWELTLTDGSDLYLLPTFKVWAEQIFGWYYFVERTVYDPNLGGVEFEFAPGEREAQGVGGYVTKMIKKRLTVKQYLIIARGAAKSMYAFTIQAFFLNVDTSTTHQITTAPTMKQAEEILSPFRTAITRARGPLFKFLTVGSLRNTTGSNAFRQKLASTKKGIENFLTGSLLEIRPMSINKLQGLRPKVSTIDEWLSGDIREDVVGAIEQGASKMDDYLILAVSSEGTVRNGSGDTIKMELESILKGEYEAPHISIWYYKLDEIEEVNEPAMWIKANPNLGKTVTYDVYHLDVERAEKAPASRNDILAKRFGIPMEGYTYFFTYEETLPHRRIDFEGMPCALGADLSQGDDFCAFTFMFPLSRGEFGVKTRSYITTLTLMKLPGAMRHKYEEFIAEGSLHILEGSVLDMTEVYDDLEQFILASEYDVRCLGFDPYNAKEFVTRWEAENGPYGIEKVIQGAKTESVPLGELKILSEQRALIFDQGLMSFAMGNAITLEDTNGNRKLLKKRAEEKIDNVSALMDAYVAYKANKEAFE